MFSTETEVKYKSTLLYPEILSYFIHFLIANIFKTHTYIITFKKAFFSDQCKETEENNRMGKTRDLFKKIRDTKGTFHAKMTSIKDRNSMDLTEAEDIKKRWQDTQNCRKKIFMTQIITMV